MNEDTIQLARLEEDWEFNVVGVYNYKRAGQFQAIFDFIRRNHDRIAGDIVEAGVFRGSSLIALGLMLKELRSTKKVFGYDTFSGFPPGYHKKDQLDSFQELYLEGHITAEHLEKVQRNIAVRSTLSQKSVNVSDISSSGNFSGTSRELVEKKIALLGLDNIVLIEGPFEHTMGKKKNGPDEIMAALMDCDLYESYRTAFSFFQSKLVQGGMIYLDEYYSLKFPGARYATNEFLADNPDFRLSCYQKDFGDFERWFLLRKEE